MGWISDAVVWLNANEGLVTTVFTGLLVFFTWRLVLIERRRDAPSLRITRWERQGATTEGDRVVMLRLTIENWGQAPATPRQEGVAFVYFPKKLMPTAETLHIPITHDRVDRGWEIPPKGVRTFLVQFRLDPGFACVWLWVPIIGERPARKVLWNPNHVPARKAKP